MSSSSPVVQLANSAKPDKRMSWNALLCQDRLHPKPSVSTQDRSAFEVDYDRLIFSKAFRRLARKTQVHPLATNDHTHNRLTHSLEVASVGRSLGKAAFIIAQNKENEILPIDAVQMAELLQSACLAHDIGNTPFGHAGERAIRLWMSNNSNSLAMLNTAQRTDLTLYEGNAQAFRIATRSVSEFEEGCINREGGLGLTAATLATMMKYPWHSDHKNAQSNSKYSVFQDDLAAFEWVANTTGLLKDDKAYCRHPLAFLVEAADDICNAIIDIEDAIDLNILSRAEVEKELMLLSRLNDKNTIAQMRAKAIGNLISQCLTVFNQYYDDIMRGHHHQPLIDLIDTKLLSAFNHLNDIAKQQVYPFQHDDELERSCNETLASILNETMHLHAGNHFPAAENLPTTFHDFRAKANQEDMPDYERFMMTMDYVAGMTDNYAVNLADSIAKQHKQHPSR